MQNLSAVSAACLVLPKAVFCEVGGFNDEDLPAALDDVDLCLRIREAGYRIVWTPYAELYNYAGLSHGLDADYGKTEPDNQDIGNMSRHWGRVLNHDPYYNPNLSLNDGTFGLAFPPRIDKPWRHSGDNYGDSGVGAQSQDAELSLAVRPLRRGLVSKKKQRCARRRPRSASPLPVLRRKRRTRPASPLRQRLVSCR